MTSGDTLTVTGTVESGSGSVDSVAADVSAFDAGTVSMTDGDSDGTYNATFTVGENPTVDDQSATITVTDTTEDSASATTGTVAVYRISLEVVDVSTQQPGTEPSVVEFTVRNSGTRSLSLLEADIGAISGANPTPDRITNPVPLVGGVVIFNGPDGLTSERNIFGVGDPAFLTQGAVIFSDKPSIGAGGKGTLTFSRFAYLSDLSIVESDMTGATFNVTFTVEDSTGTQHERTVTVEVPE